MTPKDTFIKMLPYDNVSRRSGIRRYGYLKNDGVHKRVLVIEFKDGSTYAYMEEIISTPVYDLMCAYAEQGEGLATYISKNRPLGLKIEMYGGSGNGYFPAKR